MKHLFIFALLLLGFACNDEQVKTPPLIIKPLFGTSEPFIPDYMAGRTQSCIITANWQTSITAYGPAVGAHYIDLTFSTIPDNHPVANLASGMCVYQITNYITQSNGTLKVYTYDNPSAYKIVQPNGGTQTFKFTIQDCASGATIVKRWIFEAQNCSDANFVFDNISWSNGHTANGQTGASVSTGDVC
jgi:hypothetical protein